jgi:hypothetical protein
MNLRSLIAGILDGNLPPAGSTAQPSSPTMLEAIGSTVGGLTIQFWKPRYLIDGAPIAELPVVNTEVRVSTSRANALAGIFSYSTNTGEDAFTEEIVVPAGTWYVTAVSSNDNAPSDISHILEVTTT